MNTSRSLRPTGDPRTGTTRDPSTTATMSTAGLAEVSSPGGGSASMTADTDARNRAVYGVAANAAFLALAALMVGGAAMSLTAQAGTSAADVLAAIGANPWPFLAGGIGLVLVSLFDIFTIPGLHAALGGQRRVLIILASITAVTGDLLGIIGRLAQT